MKTEIIRKSLTILAVLALTLTTGVVCGLADNPPMPAPGDGSPQNAPTMAPGTNTMTSAGNSAPAAAAPQAPAPEPMAAFMEGKPIAPAPSSKDAFIDEVSAAYPDDKYELVIINLHWEQGNDKQNQKYHKKNLSNFTSTRRNARKTK